MTNDLARRIQRASRRGDSRFYGELSLPKIGLLRALHKYAGCKSRAKAAQKMVAIEESGIDRNDEPTVEQSRARITFDVMGKDGVAVACRFLSFRG
jgi:hypothetical protein